MTCPVRDVASRSREVDVEAVDAEDDWGFDETVSAGKRATPGVRGNLEKIPRICEDGIEAVPAFVLEVIDLS